MSLLLSGDLGAPDRPVAPEATACPVLRSTGFPPTWTFSAFGDMQNGPGPSGPGPF
ncbi:MAG TPA: hypothetical protein VFM08_16265 [Nocardioides sp.]|jgi:hypothetical protein|nr:hypothetical protein [Nocardioides sp.]